MSPCQTPSADGDYQLLCWSFGRIVFSAAVSKQLFSNLLSCLLFLPCLLWMVRLNRHNREKIRNWRFFICCMGSVIRTGHSDTHCTITACVSPVCCTAGIIWPVECIPYPLRYISLAVPQTYASEALRCIMYRGNTLTDITQHALVS